MSATAFQDQGDLLRRVQDLQARLDATADPAARATAEQLVGAVVQMYGAGLRRILTTLGEGGEHGRRLAASIAEDELVASLLLIHDIHPVPLRERVLEALERVRPYMESHGGNVELLGVQSGVARIRLQGSCSGCAASAVTLEHAIKQALEATAPDLEGLDVEGVASSAGASHPAPGACGPPLPMATAGASSASRASDTSGAKSANASFELPMADPPPPLRPPVAAADTNDRCDLCATTIAAGHRHLLNLVERRIECVCESCWALRSGDAELRPTGTRTVWLSELEMPDEVWASFQIPIGLAFFMRSTVAGCVVALYPSPAGATESELHFASWSGLVALNPALADLEPDVEGLIVNRLADPPVYAIAPIDRCYALTGMVKTSWEGISGGAGVEEAVVGFFEELRAEALVA